MNRARLHERIRNSPIRDPVASPNDPPIYHAARPNGKSLRVAYYRRVKSDLIDISIYYELETHCARQWIGTKTDWDLKGVFMDADPSWTAFEEMKNGKFDMIVARTISSFGRRFSEAADRISALPFPVYFEAENVLSTDEEYKSIVDILIGEDIQHNRIKNFSLEMNKRAEVKAEIGEIIFKTIRDLRNIGPRIDKNTSQFIVGTYDEKSNKVVKCLMPINLEERNSTTRIDEYKEKAFQLATRIEDLSERIAADKEFEEQTLQMEKSEEENAFLKALNITGYNDLHKNLQKLQNFGSVDSFYDKYTKPVEAFETDSVKEWLNRYVSFNPSSSFFDFGTLTETKIDLGFKKEQSLNGSDNEREKYRKYKELYRTLYQIWIRTEFINSFTGLLFFPVAIQNISKMNDNDIRVVIELKRGAAIHPSKEIITDSLRDQRGWICHFGLVDDLFYLPRNPMAEIEYSPSQDRNPHYHVTLNGYEEDKEDEDDYEKNLQQYILEPVDTTHFSTSVSKLRPSETVWLSGGMLIKPDEEGCVKIEYSIHSTYSSGEISGVLEYTVKA